MTSFFDDFSCEESKSHNVVEEGEEAVANWVCRWVVRIVCMIIFNRKNIFLFPKHHFLILYLSFAGEAKTSLRLQLRI